MPHTSLYHKLTQAGPKRILALDGGGIKGVLTLGLLEQVENLLREQHDDKHLVLSDYFDLVGGTSTGSIIAGALAIGMPVIDIKQQYLKLGKKVFGKKSGLFNYLTKGEKYNIKPITEALQDFFGDTLFGDQEKIKTGLCILTKRADTFSTWPFINHPGGTYYDANKNIPLWQVIRASTAAPTFFVPMVMDIGENKKGTFIDGGVSMANNPALTMYLVATLKGFPFHWPTGAQNILLTSCGTGQAIHHYEYDELKQLNIMSWAGLLPEYFMTDANHFNQLILQLLSDSPTAVHIDSEMGDLKNDLLHGKQGLHYLRYDASFETQALHELGIYPSAKEIKSLSEMDNADNISLLTTIGEKAGKQKVVEQHFPMTFNLKQQHTSKKKFLKTNPPSDLHFEKVMKKRIAVDAVQIHEPFEVETMEGVMQAKAGDYLIKGVHGELYAIDQEIFKKTYEVADQS